MENQELNMENYVVKAPNACEDDLSKDEARKFAQDLKKLNPNVDIELDEKCTSIDISKPINELNLPENFYLDENNRITNKENTALSVYVSLNVNEVKKNNKNATEVNNMNKNEEIINDDDFLDEFSTKDKHKKILESKVKAELERQKEERIQEERRASKQKAREEKRKNKKTKSKVGFFKKIKNFLKHKSIMPDDFEDEEINLDSDFEDEEINLDSDFDTEKLNSDIPNKDSKKQDTAKKIEESKSDESNESNTETVNTNLSAGENLKRIAKIRSEIERLQKNKEELKNIKDASKFAKEETAKHYDEETKKLRNQIKEIVDNNKYTNEAGREISMEERDRFDRLDAVQADIIETVKKQKQINSEFNEAWYGHMGEKVTEDLLKRRSTLKNELDAINIKLNLLKQKREEIVAENPMTHARTM